MNILLGVTGSVATILTDKLISKLKDNGHEIKLVYTEKSLPFLDFEKVYKSLNISFGTYAVRIITSSPICGLIKKEQLIFGGDFESYTNNKKYRKEDKISHIELRDWADIFLIAPLSANTMAKMANGICDNLLTSVFRAWDFTKPVYVAPSMNTQMWLHPVTKTHLKTLKDWNINVIYPTVKKLACGDFGIGGLADINTIVNITEGHRWKTPFEEQFKCNYLPLYPHPGSFGIRRHTCNHTGTDRYCCKFDRVMAMEDGEIVSIGQFTGAGAGCDWWNDTWQISIKGKSGVIVYGEIEVREQLSVGDKIKTGDYIGRVLEVLKNSPKYPVEGHSRSMLHVELLDSNCIECPDWKIGEDRPKVILDPTPYLYLIPT